MSEWEENRTELPEPPHPRHVGIGLAVVALVLPVLSGSVLLFVTSFAPALAISAGTVIVSSLLLAIDAGRLGRIDLKGRQQGSAVLLFFGMCLLWILGYPIAFFRRRHFGEPNLGIPAILVAVFFLALQSFERCWYHQACHLARAEKLCSCLSR